MEAIEVVPFQLRVELFVDDNGDVIFSRDLEDYESGESTICHCIPRSCIPLLIATLQKIVKEDAGG